MYHQYLLYNVMALGEGAETTSITSPVLRYNFMIDVSVQNNTFPSTGSQARSSIKVELLLSNTMTMPVYKSYMLMEELLVT